MTRRKKRQTPEWRWGQARIDAYYDYRWRQVLDPRYEKFQRWKAGQLTHADMDRAIHETHKEAQELFKLFTNQRSWLVRAIQLDREWFAEWVADNPPPPGIGLLPVD